MPEHKFKRRALRARTLLLYSRFRQSPFQRGLERVLLRLAPSESQRVLVLSLVIGLACGLAAVAFHLSIRFAETRLIDRALAAPGRTWIAWTMMTPAIGGLVTGVALRYLVPGARGSGIPQVKAAYALGGRRVPLRDALGKFVLGVVQIGSGGSLGREGPTVQICAGLATGLGRLARISPRNLRRLLPVGAAAGIAAAFNAPIAAVTFTIEEVIGSLDQTLLSGVVVAAAVAAAVERAILGEHPVLAISSTHGLSHASSLLMYVVLGLFAAAVSIVFTDFLLGVRRWFQRLTSAPKWVHPAIGGLATGVLAVVAMSTLGVSGVTGGGYAMLGEALAAHLGLTVLASLCVLKILATVMSYSSGGAGGIFAPSLFIGGMLGGAVGILDRTLLHHTGDAPGAFALVGMGAVFAGIVRAPITSVLIIFEMTGSYGLILPLMISNMTAYGFARRFRPSPIYDALLEQDGIRLPHRRLLAEISVGEAMSSPVDTLQATDNFESIMEHIRATTHSAFPVVDAAGLLLGVLTLEDLRPHLGDESLAPIVVAGDLCRAEPPIARPLDSLETAISRMTEAGMDHLVVVAGDDGRKVIGVLTRRDILDASGRLAARGVEVVNAAP